MRIDEITTPGIVRLYRGDSTEIKRFTTEKGDPMALFGQGIYLTDSKRVANDYMAKGSTGGDIIYRFGGGTKQDAIQRWIEGKAKWLHLDGTEETGIHTWSGGGLPFSNGTKWGNLSNEIAHQEYKQRIELATELWKKLEPTVEVRKQLDGDIIIRKKQHKGSIAIFEIPADFVSKCLDAEEEIPTEVVDLLNDLLHKTGDMSTARDMNQFIKQHEYEGIQTDDDEILGGDGYRPTFRQVWTAITADSSIHDDPVGIRRGLKDLGYTGIRYLGGISMGGGYKHNAYVFWDEKFINRYRVV